MRIVCVLSVSCFASCTVRDVTWFNQTVVNNQIAVMMSDTCDCIPIMSILIKEYTRNYILIMSISDKENSVYVNPLALMASS